MSIKLLNTLLLRKWYVLISQHFIRFIIHVVIKCNWNNFFEILASLGTSCSSLLMSQRLFEYFSLFFIILRFVLSRVLALRVVCDIFHLSHHPFFFSPTNLCLVSASRMVVYLHIRQLANDLQKHRNYVVAGLKVHLQTRVASQVCCVRFCLASNQCGQ